MAASHSQESAEPARLRLYISTWHIARLLPGGIPEGLPTDLLTKNSAVFYVFDEVVCDRDGFQGELKLKDWWLSAALYRELVREGLVVPEHYDQWLQPGFWDTLRASHQGRRAIRLMDKCLQRPPSSLPKYLVDLNHDIALAHNVPDAIPYDYQEEISIFQTSKAKHQRAETVWAPDPVVRNQREKLLGRLIESVLAYLPNPELLPPVQKGPQERALRANIHHERDGLMKVVVGDPRYNHEEFLDDRLSKNFLERDRVVDSPERQEQAWTNFDKLVAVRKDTEELRKGLQEHLLKIINGSIGLAEAYLELERQLRMFESALPRRRSRLREEKQKFRFTVLTAVLSWCLSYLDFYPDLPRWGPVTPELVLGPVSAKTWEMFDRHQQRQWVNTLRRQHPLAAFDAELQEVFGRGLYQGLSLESGTSMSPN